MILQCLTVIVICQYLLFDYAQAEDIFLDCPERWTENQEVILQCTVARSKFPNQCSDSKNETYFIVNKNSRTLEKHCTVFSFNCSSSTKLTSGCYCAAEKSTVYTFNYKFSASAEYQGTWRCGVFCVDHDGNSVLTYGSSKSCSSVIVDPGYALTEDVVLVCPPRWIDKQVVTLTCSVARTRFPGLCKFWNNEMYFIISKNTISATNCTVPSFSLCTSPKPTLGCYCAEENSTHYTFLYKFMAEAGYQGTWVCSVTCVDDDGIPILKNNASSCVNKTVESEMSDPPLPVSSRVDGIVGGTVGGLVLISLFAVILFFIRRQRKVHIQDKGFSSPYKVVNHSDVSSHGSSGQRSFKISDPDYKTVITTDQSV